MMHSRLSSSIALTMALGFMPGVMEAYDGNFSADFSSGRLPTVMTAENVNGELPDEEGYKNGYTESGWTVDRFGDYGYVALSPTYTGNSSVCRNRLSTPFVAISEQSAIIWESCSVYPDFRDSYIVEAREENGDWFTLYESEPESGMMSAKSIPLGEFAGKNLQCAVTITASGYMLALKSLSINKNSDHHLPAPQSASIIPDIRFMPVIDEATGMWCNNCPKAMIEMEDLEAANPGKFIKLVTHVNDALANPEYWAEMHAYAVPCFKVNRGSLHNESLSKFDWTSLEDPHLAIEIQSASISESGNLNLTAEIITDSEYHSDVKLALGFVLKGDFYNPDDERFSQKNIVTTPNYRQFYFLPSRIPASLMKYKDVTLTHTDAWNGISGSLPERLSNGSKYSYAWSTEMPEPIDSFVGTTAVAYVMEAESGKILTACEQKITEDFLANINDILPDSDTNIRIEKVNSTTLRVCGLSNNTPAILEIFNLEGKKCNSLSAITDGEYSFNIAKGAYIFSLLYENGKKTFKIIL